jgi:precorrin-6Y C5,15-methyltransferase (decarboxylating)
MAPVTVLGLGMSPADLTPAARERLLGAEILAGGRRLLDYFPDHPAEKVVLERQVAATLRELASRLGSRRLVILASGDPNFYGVGPLAVEIFGRERVEILPNLTAVQAAAARLQVAWQDARVVSLHGRSARELGPALAAAGKLFVYTDPKNSPAAIARELLARGAAGARMAVLENLGQPDERLGWYTPAEAQGLVFAPLNLVYVERPEPGAALHLGLPEEALAHEAGLLTKLEVRAVALALLRLLPGQTLWDVGAGSGSVGLEAGLLAPGLTVYAVERRPERLAQIETNRDRFGAVWLLPVEGEAPEVLAALPDPDRVFVGGGGRELADILTAAAARLKPGGRMVVAATLLRSLETARQVLGREGLRPEVVQVQVSRGRPLAGDTYLTAANPVWLIAGSREEG